MKDLYFCSRLVRFLCVGWAALIVGSLALPPSLVEASGGAEVRPLVSGERARVQRIARDLDSAIDTLDQGGVAPFQEPANVERWQTRIERFRADLARFPQTEDHDVVSALAKLRELEALFAFASETGQRQQSEVGDVQAQLAAIEAALRQHPAPQWLPAPFTEAEALQWATNIGAAKGTAETAIEQIQQIAAVAHLPLTRGTVAQGAPYDRQDLDRLLGWANRILRGVDESVQTTFRNLQAQMETLGRELEFLTSLDPDNPHHRTNNFLREGAAEAIFGQFDNLQRIAESVTAFQVASGREKSPVALGRIADILAARDAYAANRLKAIGASTLPEHASKDARRVAIAQEILANPAFGFGEHGPIVLTTPDIVEREEQVSRAEIRNVELSLSGDITLSGTETTWTYRWEEFKFATPIRDAETDTWYVWWITAKKFSSGWERTPLHRWVSGGAVRADQILPENF